MSRHHHICHLLKPPEVKAGRYVRRGQLIGYVGNTGHSTGPHVHYEVMWNRPPSWTYYPTKLARDAVAKLYMNPSVFIRDGIPAAYTYTGTGFLRWDGTVFHPAIDINSPNDLGKPVFSPINGRVQFSAGASFIRNWLGKLVPSVYNNGFGNHLWIEQDEANPGIEV